jgi:hypothetical protein
MLPVKRRLKGYLPISDAAAHARDRKRVEESEVQASHEVSLAVFLRLASLSYPGERPLGIPKRVMLPVRLKASPQRLLLLDHGVLPSAL